MDVKCWVWRKFQETESGIWQHLRSGGSSHALNEWQLRQDGKQALHLRMSGVTGEFPSKRKRYSFAIFLCGPEVTPNDPASLIACTADGTQSFTWTSPDIGPA